MYITLVETLIVNKSKIDLGKDRNIKDSVKGLTMAQDVPSPGNSLRD